MPRGRKFPHTLYSDAVENVLRFARRYYALSHRTTQLSSLSKDQVQSALRGSSETAIAMQASNSLSERSPLRAVTNTADSPLTRKAGSTPVKKASTNVKKTPLPRLSLPLPPSNSKDKGSEKQKKPRPSLNKRVSFGGNSINVFYKQSEFSPQDNEPPAKAPRTTSRSSPVPLRSPSLLRPDARVLPMEDEDVSDDNVSVPNASSIPETLLLDKESSPPVHENPSPIAPRRDSIGFNDRQSFGLFIDEDISKGDRDVIMDDQEDLTTELPRLKFAAQTRRVSNASALSDGDITQPLYGFLRDAVEDEYLRNAGDSAGEANGQSSPPNSSGDGNPGAFTMKTQGLAQQDVLEPKTANDPTDIALTETEDNGGLNSRSGDRSELDVPADQIGAQEHSMEPISISPAGADELNDSSVCPSPTVPVRARPIPPNCRKLFDSDANEDEDNTLHYHDKPGRSADAPSSSQRKPLGVLSALPSTPLSATQSRLRSAIEERASASAKRNAASKLRELSTSAMRSSQPGTGPLESEAACDKSFNFREFLQAVQLNFDRKAETRQRGQSLAPQNYPPHTSNFDQSSFEGEMYESVRKASVLETFKHQIEILRAKIAQVNENLEDLEREIDSSHPPLFSRMAEVEAMPVHEITTYRVSMKRLRKLSTLKNKQEWVTDRQIWEKDLTEKLNAAIAAVGQDKFSLCERREQKRAFVSLFVEQVAGLGFGAVFTNEKPKDSTEEDNKQRAAFVQELSIVRDMTGYLDSLGSEEEDLVLRRESAAPSKSSLLSSCRELRKNANANNERSVKRMIIEQEELNSIVSGFSGVNLMRVNKNSISLRALGMMDIQFSLHDDKVINTSCKTVSLSKEVVSCPAWQPYIDGAVSLVNWNGGVKHVKYVRDIPGALYRCTSALRQVRLVYEDAAFFLDRNMGRILSADFRCNEESPCLILAVEASFYSLALRSKFDVTVTVTTRLPTDSAGHLVQDATVEKVHRYFGDKPEDELISDVLIKSGRRDLGVYSLADGLNGVWRSLS